MPAYWTGSPSAATGSDNLRRRNATALLSQNGRLPAYSLYSDEAFPLPWQRSGAHAPVSTVPALRNSCPLSVKKSSFSCVSPESVGDRRRLDHKPTSRGLALAKMLLHAHIRP